MAPEGIAARLQRIGDAIDAAARRAGRDPAGVRLLAVSKRVDPARIRAAYEAGATAFGENYVQETLGKVDALPHDLSWHLIGHLQSNKAKRAVEVFSTIHTLDRPSLARALEKAAAAREATVEVLLQINAAGEVSKAGASPEEAVDLARRAPEWPHLRIRGLMAIPPYRADPEAARPDFRALRELAQRIGSLGLPGVEMTELSMGMSHDFEVAVEEGATWVRVGTALFGPRDGIHGKDPS